MVVEESSSITVLHHTPSNSYISWNSARVSFVNLFGATETSGSVPKRLSKNGPRQPVSPPTLLLSLPHCPSSSKKDIQLTPVTSLEGRLLFAVPKSEQIQHNNHLPR